MITYSDVRLKDGREFPMTRSLTPGKGLEILVNCELGFGGRVVECLPDKVVTSTTCLGCVDTSTFTGSVADMRYLYDIAKIVVEMRNINRAPERERDNGTVGDIHRLHRALKEGGGAIRGALLHMLGRDDAAFAAAVTNHSTKDIVAALSLLADGDADMATVHQLLS